MPKTAISSTPTYTSTSEADDSVRLYEPRLVRLIGAHGAMVFQQMRYWLELDGGREHDGYHWIWKSGTELADDIGISKDQTKRTLVKLCSIGLLVAIENPISGWDRVLWYRINPDHEFMQETDSSHAAGDSASCKVQNRTMQSANLHHARGKSAPSKEQIRTDDGAKAHRRRSKSAPAIPETTSLEHSQESTSQTPPQEDSRDGARDSVCMSVEDEASSTAKGKARRGRKYMEAETDGMNPSSGVNSGSGVASAKDTPEQRMAKLRANAAARQADRDDIATSPLTPEQPAEQEPSSEQPDRLGAFRQKRAAA